MSELFHNISLSWGETLGKYTRNIILYLNQFHRYTEYVSDGDCKIKKHLDDANIYPGITIEKVECANHLGIFY